MKFQIDLITIHLGIANPVLIGVLWILSIISGICIGIHQVVSRFKTKASFKTKITICIRFR